MYLPKIVDSVLVREVKKLFEGLRYKWSILKGEVSTAIFVDTKWIQCKWEETMKLSIDFLKPVKFSDLVSPIIGYVYTTYPEYEKPIKELLKELDSKPFLTKGMIENFKYQWQNHKFEIEYLNKELIISQTYGENYFKFILNEELICEILNIAAKNKDNQEGVQDFVYSILTPKMQEVIMARLKEDYEEIREFHVEEMLENILGDKNNIDIDNDYDSKNDKFIIKVNNQKKYVIEIVNEHKALITVNSKPAFIVHTMTEIEEFLKSIVEK